MTLASTSTIDDFPTELLGPDETVQFGTLGPDPTDLPGGMGFIFDAVPAFMGIFFVAFIGILAFGAFVWVRNYKTTKNAGMDIFTLETDLATRAAKSQMLAPKKTIEEKLAELDSLLARGLITRDEYTQARLKALTD
ncbi:SHOCT domain-containing protein [Paeniglutamicibacter sp. NPDC091659]|uniref:SHOCT domain-containing protein n=1 Tax=Paeniglutamicibacter sp. NPDC091659 TaxID=3364389 RepID=UPI003820CC8D